jgi:hypothetical protein
VPKLNQNCNQYSGNTPLHIACNNKSVSLEVITSLMDQWPAGCLLLNKKGRNPLDAAEESQREDGVLPCLIEGTKDLACALIDSPLSRRDFTPKERHRKIYAHDLVKRHRFE